ncbi:MAG TPA: EamA family transporter [Acetobacteraceae bacterium]|nr:EamA family transporter [Acetobacteraceae bacterium]
MPTGVMFAVLGGALLHAVWNVLAKSGRDPLIETSVILLGGATLAVLLLPVLPPPAPASWPFIAASAVLQCAYFGLLALAYRGGDMSLAYPLMRGGAPLLLVLATRPIIGESLGLWTSGGILAICGGVLLMALAERRRRRDWRTIGLALMNAAVIAAYTMIDGLGARRSGEPMSYTLAVFLGGAALFAPVVAWRHGGRLTAAVRRHWHLGLIGGACIVTSYGVALWAMTRAPIAPVAALRETSILFGLVLARAVLHERLGPARIAGGLLILAGAGALRLG